MDTHDGYTDNDRYVVKKCNGLFFLYHERIIQQISCIFVIA